MAAKRDTLLVARETFSVDLDGREIVVWKGETRVRGSHRLVKGREHLFRPVDDVEDVAPESAKRSRKR